MKERFKQIRLSEGLSMKKFGEKLNISDSAIALIESGKRNVTDRIISDVCRIFSANEEWLRTGTGEMYQPKTKNEEIQEFANEVMSEMDETFRKRLVLALSKMTPEQWELLEQIIDTVKKQD